MKVRIPSGVRRILSLSSLLVLGTLYSCLNGSGNVTPQTPVAALSFTHGAPATSGLNVLMDGAILNTSAFNYSTYSGYVSLNPGTHTLRFNSSSDGSTKLDTSVSVAGDKAYSLFLYNKGATLKSFFVIDDSPTSVSPTGMMVRVVHLSPDLQEVKVVLVGESKSLADPIDYSEISTFSEYTTKSSTVEVRSAVDNHVIISQNFEPMQQQYITLAILGYVTPPVGNANKLLIKTIVN